MTGNAEKSEALLRVIRPYGIRNIARTGCNWIYPRLITLDFMSKNQLKFVKPA